jgi:hypothetical protein
MEQDRVHPEDCADELNRIVRILTTEASEKLDALPEDERQNLHERLDELLDFSTTYATVQCIQLQTREFLIEYTNGVPKYTLLRSIITDAF